MLKKLLLIILIAVLACSQVGYYVIMHHSQYVQKKVIKERIFQQLKDEELEIISLTDNKQHIYWEEEGKEFLLNGEMYDVVKTKRINGIIILYCINDKKEKSLIDNYNLITKHNSDSDKKGKSNIDNSINLFVYPNGDNIDVYSFTFLDHFYSFDSRLQKIFLKTISPPPKA